MPRSNPPKKRPSLVSVGVSRGLLRLRQAWGLRPGLGFFVGRVVGGFVSTPQTSGTGKLKTLRMTQAA